MSHMINDLLTYASAQIGREIPILREAADMDDICRTSLDEIQSANPDAILNFESSGDLRGHFDPARFQQVLSNLLNNAVKYGESGLPVLLSARGEGESITVQVKNSGNTIPSESLEIIFNPLIQLSSDGSNSNPRLTDSIGLGLFIAREIVKGHNGTVEVKSSDKEGTVFTVNLPRN
jgi:signal transduction histidine kinase